MTSYTTARRFLILKWVTAFLVALSIGLIIILFERFLEEPPTSHIPFHNVLYPYVEFRPPSNSTWRSEGPSPSSHGKEVAVAYTNADALRVESPDYPLAKQKPPRQLRIAMIGGSTVHIGTSYDATLPGSLRRLLRERYLQADIEVINAGIISAISRQELIALITTVVDYEPDILITYDGINDSGQMLYYEKRPNFPYNFRVMEEAWQQYVTGKQEPIWKEIARRSAILRKLLVIERGGRDILQPLNPDDLIKAPDIRKQYALAHTDNWDRIRRIAMAYGIRPVFVLQPTSLYSTNARQPAEDVHNANQNILHANYLLYKDMRHSVKAFAQTHSDLTVLDLAEMLPKEAFYDGAHVFDEVNIEIAVRLVSAMDHTIQELLFRRQPH